MCDNRIATTTRKYCVTGWSKDVKSNVKSPLDHEWIFIIFLICYPFPSSPEEDSPAHSPTASRIPVLRKTTPLKPIQDIHDEDEEEDETDFIMEQVRSWRIFDSRPLNTH